MMELEIYGAAESDLTRIYAALDAAHVEYFPEESKALLASVGIYIKPLDLGDAMVVAHNLGFTTDEDEEDGNA